MCLEIPQALLKFTMFDMDYTASRMVFTDYNWQTPLLYVIKSCPAPDIPHRDTCNIRHALH